MKPHSDPRQVDPRAQALASQLYASSVGRQSVDELVHESHISYLTCLTDKRTPDTQFTLMKQSYYRQGVQHSNSRTWICNAGGPEISGVSFVLQLVAQDTLCLKVSNLYWPACEASGYQEAQSQLIVEVLS